MSNATTLPVPTPPRDRLGRGLHDLRISVTDRCNFRCGYCMPKEVFDSKFQFLPQAQLLSFEELTRVARILQLGVRKLRLTGGEPLIRRELHKLVRMLADLGPEDLALTTNGVLLAEHASALANAGLKRVTVSLDALDDDVFRRMSDSEFAVTDVLRGIDAAAEAGLPIKVNAVVRRGVNDHEIVKLARHFHGTGHVLRFIEYMDVGASNGWQLGEVVLASEILQQVRAEFPAERIAGQDSEEVAERWRYLDGAGEFGVISSVSKPFCGNCSRARVAADGRLFTCLFASTGTDLRAPVRHAATDAELEQLITAVWQARSDRYSELRAARPIQLRKKIEMSYIGG